MKMKKNKLSNFLKIGILLFGISLLILNCDKDLEIDNPIESSDFVIDVKSLNQEQINPKILSFLASKNGLANKSNSSSKNIDYKALINFDNIIQVIDQLGNTNYTFILEVKDNDPTTFYNLIVNESQTSTEPHITIHKFVSDPSSLENFINSNYNFEKFNGKILKYNLPNFLSSHTDYLSKSTTAIDDCLCSEIPISGGSGYGSGGSTNPVGGGPGGPISGGGGSDPSNPFDNCDTYMYVSECATTDRWHLESNCGDSSTAKYSMPVLVCGGEPDVYLNKQSSKIDDCNNPCEGTGSGGTAAILLPLNQFELIEDHCPDLKNIIDTNKANAKPFLENLKTTVDQEGENGVSMKKDGDTYTNTNLPTTTTNQIGIPMGGANYAAAHSHPSLTTYPMFSWNDIYVLLNLYLRAESSVRNEVTFMLASKNHPLFAQVNVFALKINDFRAFRRAFYKALSDIVAERSDLESSDSIEDKLDALNEKLGRKYGETEENQQEKAFLDFFKSFELSLYKANDNLDSWSEVKTAQFTPTASGVVEIPCN